MLNCIHFVRNYYNGVLVCILDLDIFGTGFCGTGFEAGLKDSVLVLEISFSIPEISRKISF